MTIDSLLNSLDDLKGKVDKPLERRIIDTAVWFHRNRERIPPENLKARVEFQDKAIDILIEVMALLLDRMHKVEGRKTSESLYLPRGISMSGDVKLDG